MSSQFVQKITYPIALRELLESHEKGFHRCIATIRKSRCSRSITEYSVRQALNIVLSANTIILSPDLVERLIQKLYCQPCQERASAKSEHSKSWIAQIRKLDEFCFQSNSGRSEETSPAPEIRNLYTERSAPLTAELNHTVDPFAAGESSIQMPEPMDTEVPEIFNQCYIDLTEDSDDESIFSHNGHSNARGFEMDLDTPMTSVFSTPEKMNKSSQSEGVNRRSSEVVFTPPPARIRAGDASETLQMPGSWWFGDETLQDIEREYPQISSQVRMEHATSSSKSSMSITSLQENKMKAVREIDDQILHYLKTSKLSRSKDAVGYLYLFRTPDFPNIVKAGITQDQLQPYAKFQKQRNGCDCLDNLECVYGSDKKFQFVQEAERLVKLLLKKYQAEYPFHCGNNHTGWKTEAFEVPEDIAIRCLQWAEQLMQSGFYNDDGAISAFWSIRIDDFQHIRDEESFPQTLSRWSRWSNPTLWERLQWYATVLRREPRIVKRMGYRGKVVLNSPFQDTLSWCFRACHFVLNVVGLVGFVSLFIFGRR